jgi:proteasome lid subunit RPN8/RPN11
MTDTNLNLVDYHISKPGIPLPPIAASLYEYMMAGNGIFVRGARREFQTQFCITPCTIRGLADLEPSLEFNALRVPREIVEDMLRRARQASDKQGQPCEIVFHLELDESLGWQCHVPSQRQSPTRAKPSDDSPDSSYARACIEVHSHVDMHASFSSLDDQDEQGFRIYVVLGCISTTPVVRVRVGLYGYRHDIPANWVFDLPPGIGDAVTGEGTILGPL